MCISRKLSFVTSMQSWGWGQPPTHTLVIAKHYTLYALYNMLSKQIHITNIFLYQAAWEGGGCLLCQLS